MLKRAITYTSYDGKKVTEDFYFHISKVDVAKMELSNVKDGGLQGALQRMVKDQDGSAVAEEIDKLILMSVGKPGPDGRRFIKNDEIRQDFASSPAYETIFMELVTDADKAAAFIAGAAPNDISPEELKKMAAEQNVFEQEQPSEEETGSMRIQSEPADPTALEQGAAATPRKTYTRQQLIEMDGIALDKAQAEIAAGEATYVSQ